MRWLSAILIPAAVLSIGCPKAPKPTSTEPTVDNRNTNYQAGAGVVVNTVKAGKRTGVMLDYEQLKTIIFAMELENGRMPSKEEIRTELARNGKNLLKLIDEGAIIMPTQPESQGIWAYEVDADKAGGIVIYANSVGRKTADEVKTLLGQK